MLGTSISELSVDVANPLPWLYPGLLHKVSMTLGNCSEAAVEMAGLAYVPLHVSLIKFREHI